MSERTIDQLMDVIKPRLDIIPEQLIHQGYDHGITILSPEAAKQFLEKNIKFNEVEGVNIEAYSHNEYLLYDIEYSEEYLSIPSSVYPKEYIDFIESLDEKDFMVAHTSSKGCSEQVGELTDTPFNLQVYDYYDDMYSTMDFDDPNRPPINNWGMGQSLSIPTQSSPGYCTNITL